MLCLNAPSDAGWASAALSDIDGVLKDHAHCEMKAATNALSLVARYPGNTSLAHALTDLAREEIDHFQRVLSVLTGRGLVLGPPPVDVYAAELRKACGSLPRRSFSPLVDRLLVGAVIEARSCERFKLLAAALVDARHARLRDFYEELFVTEARHHRTFVDLAVVAAAGAAGEQEITSRLAELAGHEAAIVARLPSHAERATIHG